MRLTMLRKIMKHSDNSDHGSELDPIEIRVRALESLLVEKKLVDRAALDVLVDYFENKVGPMNGGQVVVRAWKDSNYKERLLKDGSGAIAELGFTGFQGEDLVVVENTRDVHNVIVCTLCSCYPWSVLGLPPAWYKSNAYRARIVIEPREVLKEFGLELHDDMEIRVWDSTSEVRYLVLPEAPENAVDMGEDELAKIVTRNSMVGTAKVFPQTMGKE